jgi:hypothetical protein
MTAIQADDVGIEVYQIRADDQENGAAAHVGKRHTDSCFVLSVHCFSPSLMIETWKFLLMS